MKKITLTFIIALSVLCFSCSQNNTKTNEITGKFNTEEIDEVEATCYGYNNCKACKTCKYCKHCSKDGNTCGVCK